MQRVTQPEQPPAAHYQSRPTPLEATSVSILYSWVLWGAGGAFLMLIILAGIEVSTISSGGEVLVSYSFSYTTLLESVSDATGALLIYSQNIIR
jgi:hypothetical protein